MNLRTRALLLGLLLTGPASLGACADPEEDPAAEPDDPLPPFGEPIQVDPEDHGQWVWIDMPDMICSDGTPGGFAVNFSGARGDLLFHLQGGGICYDALTCAFGGAPTSVGSDPLFTALDGGVRQGGGIFDRSHPENPFRDWNYVSVPHCTGDHHTGDRIVEEHGVTYHHVGYANIAALLKRLVPTFAEADQIVLTGFSAGGVGITANYHQMARAFARVGQPPPRLFIDGGPFLRPPWLDLGGQQVLRERWGLDQTIGAFCSECFSEGYHAIYKVNAALHPELRASLVTTTEDSVVVLLYSVINGAPLTGEQMREGLDDLRDWAHDEAPALSPTQLDFFYYPGAGHGTLHGGVLYDQPGLLDFVREQLQD